MKIALIHDHLIQEGGAERVLKIFHETFPEAPLFTLLYDRESMSDFFRDQNIRTSFLQRIPWGIKKYKWLLPLMPTATEHYDLGAFDTVLSSSSAFAKGVLPPPGTLHVCYCHTPTRYLWSDTVSYVEELPANPLVKKTLPLLLSHLRVWDRLAAERVDFFIANSKTVQQRIRQYYRRESDVIYPPVETHKFFISETTDNYYLSGGRLVPYKRFDLIVEAFNRLGIPLKIFGQGPELEKLRTRAKPNIEFLGKISDEERARLFSRCIAFLHPQEEDFGIMAVEAMASGRPVIAYGKGGALETIEEGVTGEFFDRQNWQELGDKIIRFNPKSYSPCAIKEHAERFNIERFKKEITDYIRKKQTDFLKQQP